MPSTIGSYFRVILTTIFTICLCLTIISVASGKIYRWVDEKGQLHFSDSPQNVPAEIRDKTKEYKPDSSSISIATNGMEYDKPNRSVAEPATGRATDQISIPFTDKEGSASRVIIDVTFNDTVTVPILLDTGSPGLIITNELANRLGLFDQDGSQLMVLISGIGGEQSAARTIIDKVSIDTITEKFIPAHIVADMSDAYQGLIGMDILSSYTLTIDSANKRLIANLNPAVQDLPGNRSQTWWQSSFQEFTYYNDFWKYHANLISKSNSPYARLAPSDLRRLKSFIQHQKSEAENLYTQLERFARFQSVPRHWRR